MLNIGGLHEGFVLDHIEAGKSMEIYKYLNLDKFDCCVAIIKNARSNKMGRKDIIKIECPSTRSIWMLLVLLITILRSISSKMIKLWRKRLISSERDPQRSQLQKPEMYLLY